VPATIDVVVPVHDNYELTHRCLTHLAAQTVAHRTIVVDDGSTDGTPARLREEWPAVEVLQLGRNVGYTGAVNLGVAHGRGELVVLLNNDVELREDFLERLAAPMLADPGVGSVASTMLAPGEQAIDSVGVTVDATLAGFARLQGLPASRAADVAPVLIGPEGTAGGYRRAAWEQVGGLDERIRAYMEILDLAMRLRAAGWRSACAPDAAGVHLGSRTFGRLSARQRRLAGFSRGYLLRRYGVLSSRWALRAAFTECAVMAADAAVRRDLEATRGRLEGWRAAAGLPRHARPPAAAIDASIGLAASLALRRGALRGTG